MSTVNILIQTALNVASEENPSFYTIDVKNSLEEKLQQTLETLIPGRLTLDSDKPDFESIYLRLVQELQTDPTWTDLVPTGTGMTLLRNIAAGFSYLGFAVERAVQESMAGTGSAFAETSIMSGARMLGVNPQRRIPSRVNVLLSRLDFSEILTIPAFTQFSVNGVSYFSREQFTFNENELELNVVLYQGEIIRLNAVSEGMPLERIEIGTESGLISQEDVYVFVDGEQWKSRLIGPYNFDRYEKSVYVATLPNSNVEIQFGDNRYGAMPSVNASIEIVWAETDGEIQNSSAIGLAVTYTNPPSGVVVTGVTTSQIFGGSEALSSEFYNLQAPHIRSSNQRAVRRSDFKAVALQYPNVVDALFQGQAQLNPGKRSWMNVYSATILTKRGVVWDTFEWENFVSYMRTKAIDNIEMLRLDPIPIDIEISANVNCRPQANLSLLKSQLEADLLTAYSPRLNALGFSLYHSDISEILEGKNEYADVVEYVTNITPMEDTIVSSPIHYVNIKSIDLNMVYTTRNGYSGRVD